jgi:hypothetical protein
MAPSFNLADRRTGDSFRPNRELDECIRLTVMMGFAQAFGFVLIRLALACLSMPSDQKEELYTFVNWIVFGAAAILLISSWWEKLAIIIVAGLGGDPTFKPLSAIRREGRIINVVLFLVFLDTLILLYLIKATGGLGHSPLDPLLPTIPIIAIILRQPRKTVMWAVAIQMMVTPVIVLHRWGHMNGLKWYPSWIHPSWVDTNVYRSEGDPRFIMAFSIVAIGAILLSVSEYNITHSGSLLLGDFRLLKQYLKGSGIRHHKRLVKLLRQGAKAWVHWLELHMFPPEDLSKVHASSVVAFQAAILSFPYWEDEPPTMRSNKMIKTMARNRLVRDVSFITYAAHWIDDQFDPLRPQSDTLYDVFQEKTPVEILRDDERINELMRRMALRTPNQLAARFVAQHVFKIPLPSPDCIRRAVTRIIFGGFIQNANSPERLRQLLQNYVDFISRGLSSSFLEYYANLAAANRLIPLWVTTKVVIELWAGRSRNFSLDRAEFLNMLYGPILYYQDIDSEREQEHFGAAFGKTVESDFPTAAELRGMIQFCVSLETRLFPSGLPHAQQKQLALLRSMYREQLPAEIYDAYNHFLGGATRAVGQP